MNEKVKLAIFASGSGTNAENLIKYFLDRQTIAVGKVFSNKKEAYVHERAKRLGVPSSTFSKKEFQSPDFLAQLKGFDYIILAGFLWLIPNYLVKAFPDKIINIHPSLLPKFGGRGMYGAHVHEAVIKNHEKQSGITIHLVNEEYDKGKILFQADYRLIKGETPDSLAKKIHELEYEHFPKVVEEYVLK